MVAAAFGFGFGDGEEGGGRDVELGDLPRSFEMHDAYFVNIVFCFFLSF